MTALDSKIPPKVKKTIGRVGVAVTIKARPGNYDAATLTTGGAPAFSPVSVLATPPVPVSTKLLENDERVSVEDAVVYVAGLGLSITPDVGMVVTIDGRDFRVVVVERLASGSAVAAWGLVLRR